MTWSLALETRVLTCEVSSSLHPCALEDIQFWKNSAEHELGRGISRVRPLLGMEDWVSFAGNRRTKLAYSSGLKALLTLSKIRPRWLNYPKNSANHSTKIQIEIKLL
eukprot:TCALIF_07348-PA protein Name:"Protein of unknown function" AED:0.20 eAED:0.20 QI:0/0.5/0.33/0.66/0.5/0.66/3/139/106